MRQLRTIGKGLFHSFLEKSSHTMPPKRMYGKKGSLSHTLFRRSLANKFRGIVHREYGKYRKRRVNLYARVKGRSLKWGGKSYRRGF